MDSDMDMNLDMDTNGNGLSIEAYCVISNNLYIFSLAY